MRQSILLLAAFLIGIQAFAQKEAFSAAELQKLNAGEMVTHTLKKEGWAWPESTHYILLDISPYEAMALFSDFNHQCKYIEDLIDSKVGSVDSPQKFDVNWTAKMPWPYNETKYKTSVKMECLGTDNYYCHWTSIEAEDWDDSYGAISFKFWEDKTLLTYTNWVEPSSWVASLFKGTYVSKTESSVAAIAEYLQNRANNDPSYLKTRCSNLDQIFPKK